MVSRMIARKTLTALSLASLVFAAGCSDVIQKSANPLSPTIAGPLDGVTFTAPVSVTPAQNAQIKYVDQPVSFAFDSATSSSPRPFTMHLQVASDYGFANIKFDRAGFEKPENSARISFRLTDRLPKGVYFWRVRAEDGANNSDWSAPAAFEALDQVIIGIPTTRSPINNERVASRTPTLTVGNSAASGPHRAVQYQFQGSTNASFTGVVADVTVGEGSGSTAYVVPTSLSYDTTYYWRARASDGEVTSDWTPTAVFRTPVTPTTPPPGGGGGGPVASCAGANSGPTIVACIAGRYPERLVAGVSLSTRQANMSFLRDRIIEMGRCQGKDWAWNLKRGGPDISIDFITERINGQVEGHDIAFDYDNTSTTLVLYWGGGDFPSYGGYTNSFSCGG
jgi:hypothetical protein